MEPQDARDIWEWDLQPCLPVTLGPLQEGVAPVPLLVPENKVFLDPTLASSCPLLGRKGVHTVLGRAPLTSISGSSGPSIPLYFHSHGTSSHQIWLSNPPSPHPPS